MEDCTYTELLERQRRFFSLGHTLDVEYRKSALRKLKKAIAERQDEIAEALCKDLGKSKMEAYLTETGMLLSSIKYALRHIKGWSRPKRVWPNMAVAPAKCRIVPEPYGSCLIIAPWNYPVLLALDPLVSAIAAGNCAVVKPSEMATASAAVVRDIVQQTFNVEYVNVVEGGPEETEALLSAGFDYIFFTGSPEKGRLVMERAAKTLTPVTLELGGKSPCIIDEGVNFDSAMRRIVFGKILNAGQTCVAPDYLLVHVSQKEALAEAFSKHVTQMLGKVPLDSKDYPHIINQRHFDRITAYLSQGNVLYGGTFRNDTLQICPTLLEISDADAPVMQEEIFGPVLPVLYFREFTDALYIVANKPKPLAFYVFTNDGSHEKEALAKVSAGGVCINDCVMHLSCPSLPFGGVGNSGMGYSHGKYGFDAFSHHKAVLKKPFALDFPVRYQPYNRVKQMLVKWAMS